MKPSHVLKELTKLKEAWRKQGLKFTHDQQVQYNTLLALRRERVKYFHENGMVWKGGAAKPAPTDK